MYSYYLYVKAGVYLIRRSNTATKDISVRSTKIKVGTIIDGVRAEVRAQMLLDQHVAGTADLWDQSARVAELELTLPQLKARIATYIHTTYSQATRDASLGVRTERDSSTGFITAHNRLWAYVDEKYPRADVSIICPKLFADFAMWMLEERKYAIRTIKQTLGCVGSVFRGLNLLRTLGLDPDEFRLAVSPKFLRQQSVARRLDESDYLTQTDIEILKAADMPNKKCKLLALTLIYTGWRISIEALNIRMSDLDLANRRVWLRVAWEDKVRPSDWYDLSASAYGYIDEYVRNFRSDAEPGDLLFNMPYVSFQTFCKRNLAKLLGKPVRPHMLRHTFAVTLLNAGGSLWTVAAMLRHKNLTMIETTYGHISRDVNKDLLLKI